MFRVPDEYLIAAAYDPQLEELAGDKAAAEEGIDSAAANVERAQFSSIVARHPASSRLGCTAIARMMAACPAPP